MNSANREDDLLTKLKNCIGSLPSHSHNRTASNYCASVSRPQPLGNSVPMGKGGSELGRIKQFVYNREQDLRQKRLTPQLSSYRNSLDTIGSIPCNSTPRPIINPNQSKKYPQSLRQDVKYPYYYEKQVKSQPSTFQKNNQENSHIHRAVSDVKQILSQKYSLKQSNRSPPRAALQSCLSLNKTSLRPQKGQEFEAIALKYKTPTTTMENYCSRQRTSTAHSYRGNSAVRREIVPQIVQRQKGMTNREGRSEGMRVLEKKEISAGVKEECNAMTKLKKISELNEKINERIRNIIAVFQDQKV